MNCYKICLLIPFPLFAEYSLAQNYHGINGSSYSGSLAPGSNPAAIVHVPYAWDITLFSMQFKQSSNAFKIEKYSFLSSPKNIEIATQPGIKKRYLSANQDIRLLNARLNLTSRSAIAFGANLRNYGYVSASETNWQDTIYTLGDFMKINVNKQPLAGDVTATGWAELYASYAQTIMDDGDRLLNAGITIKLNRALVGAYATAGQLGYSAATGGAPGYLVNTGYVQYGYSANFNQPDSNNTAAANRRSLLQNNPYSISVDIGLEYILLSPEDMEEASAYAYQTKIGISVMDIGKNKIRFGSRSRMVIAGMVGVTDTVIENKFSTVTSFDQFNDSMATSAGAFSELTGDFYIYQPTRVVINVDQHLVNNFFLNAELTIPVLRMIAQKSLLIRDHKCPVKKYY